MAYRGTEPYKDDVLTDLGQGLNFSMAQYAAAQSLAFEITDYAASQGISVSFTGHSLGGGLAAAAVHGLGSAGGYASYTFNAAGLNFRTWAGDLGGSSGTDTTRAYYVRGDPLHVAQTIPGIPAADGVKIPLQGNGQFISASNHKISTVIEALAAEVRAKCN